MIYFYWLLSLVILYLFVKKKNKNRIDEILNMLKRMENQDYRISFKQDDFSILEDQIYKLFLELVEEKEETKKLSEKQVENLEDIAHQIKTPITSMLFAVENLELDLANNLEVKLLKRQLLRLDSLSDILLKLSSLDAQENPMDEEIINLIELVEYGVETLDIRDNIDIDIDSSLKDKKIKGDFYWLAEAITNIIKNAINLPKIQKIYFSSEENPIYISLKIKDDGGGIQENNMTKIFRRFYKTPDSKGFGIGLALAKSIIEKNKGNVSVRNIDGGAEFSIKFYKIT